MKIAAIIFYILITFVAFLVLLAFSKTALSGSGRPELGVILVYVVNPAVFFGFMGFALYLQSKLPGISVVLFGKVLLCGFLLQLSLGLHGVPNWSVGVGIILLLVCLVSVFSEATKMKGSWV